jgi:undecaprenyl-phosphate galactose phosphotransferase
LCKKLLKRGYLKKNVLVIGAGEAANMLAAQLEVDTDLGLRIVGFVDDDPKKRETRIFNKPVLGKTSDISKELLAKYSVKRFFIAINFISYERLIGIIKYCRRFELPISLVAKHFNIIDDKLNVSYFDGVSFATFNYFGAASLFYAVFKRTFDLVVSSILLILLSPLFLVLAILIKLTSEGPVFYKPVMVGRGGRRFVMYKFRSMCNHSDHRVHRELLENIIVDGEKKGEKIKNDPRITGVGRFLRKHSLDELPQLFNVFLGQMSLVGPRPCIPYELALYKKWHKLRLSVEPGITGLWQAYGRSNVSFNDMVILDIYYIRNRSIWLDYSILLKTISVVLLGYGGS